MCFFPLNFILYISLRVCFRVWAQTCSMSYTTENTFSPPWSEVRLSSQADPGKWVQATEQWLLVPVTTAVLFRDFSTSLRRWSPRRDYSYLNCWVHCPWRREEKNRRNQEPILWWLQNWTVLSVWTWDNTFPEQCPGWLLVVLCAVFPTTLHLLRSKIGAPQAHSLFLFLLPPFLSTQEKSHHSVKTPFNLCKTSET